MSPGTEVAQRLIDWRGYPITAQVSDAAIDARRSEFQDEYVEWWLERDGGGRPARITFTTEFAEYFEALAQVGADVLKEEIANLVPGAAPTDTELFGAGPNSAGQSGRTRARRFRSNLSNNPWNIGPKGILCLTQQFNTLGALFNLVGACGVARTDIDPGSVCANVGGACGPGRNSDPAVCEATQRLARDDFACSLRDPCGVGIRSLAGNWTMGGEPLDINDPATNQGLWTVSRNGRRAVLSIPDDLRLNDDRVQSGARVADNLFVGADAVAAPDASLPEWARTGSEQQIRGMV